MWVLLDVFVVATAFSGKSAGAFSGESARLFPAWQSDYDVAISSVTDFSDEVAKDTRKRVVGVLLGTTFKGTVDVTNSYAVPFEEDDKDPSIWFLDHNYHEEMFSMFKRINAKEHVVGWYSTGPKLRKNDLDIHGLFNDYALNPVLVIIDVQPTELGLPTKAYYAIEEVNENATQKSKKVFVHVSSEIAAHEVEEIGVEHLLRDVKDTTISTLATEVLFNLWPNVSILPALVVAFAGIYLIEADRLFETRTLAFALYVYLLPVNFAVKTNDQMLVIYLSSLIRSVIALHNLINNKEIRSYLDLVIEGKLPLNHEILYHLQDIFNLLPNLNVAELVKAFAVKTNDQMLVIYLSSLIRSVIALHNLINNKLLNMEHEKAEDAKPATQPPVAGLHGSSLPTPGYQAHLVANWRSQQFGIYCRDTFSPVVEMATIRFVLSLGLSWNWPILQLDVKIAFLNGDLSKTPRLWLVSRRFVVTRRRSYIDMVSRNAISDPTLYRSLACGSLVAYSDVDWAGCLTIKRSTSGYCIFLRDNPLSWSSKWKHILFRPSAEVEYKGVTNAVTETALLRNIFRELHTSLLFATII
nr:26S proteasome non-ATPase regulatory subunit 7 homolog A [Tanacetum cinerariifolium]